MKRVMKYILKTKSYGLNIEPLSGERADNWEMVVYSDSDWGSDMESITSVSGYVIFLMRALFCGSLSHRKPLPC